MRSRLTTAVSAEECAAEAEAPEGQPGANAGETHELGTAPGSPSRCLQPLRRYCECGTLILFPGNLTVRTCWSCDATLTLGEAAESARARSPATPELQAASPHAWESPASGTHTPAESPARSSMRWGEDAFSLSPRPRSEVSRSPRRQQSSPLLTRFGSEAPATLWERAAAQPLGRPGSMPPTASRSSQEPATLWERAAAEPQGRAVSLPPTSSWAAQEFTLPGQQHASDAAVHSPKQLSASPSLTDIETQEPTSPWEGADGDRPRSPMSASPTLMRASAASPAQTTGGSEGFTVRPATQSPSLLPTSPSVTELDGEAVGAWQRAVPLADRPLLLVQEAVTAPGLEDLLTATSPRSLHLPRSSDVGLQGVSPAVSPRSSRRASEASCLLDPVGSPRPSLLRGSSFPPLRHAAVGRGTFWRVRKASLSPEVWLVGTFLAVSLIINGALVTLWRGNRSAAATLAADINTALADSDGDGVPDHHDFCPHACDDGYDCRTGGWISGRATDFDGDGCKDGVEDPDLDNDGILNGIDRCPLTPQQYTFVSNIISDFDGDGCADGVEDNDDDNDTVLNSIDKCPRTLAGVESDAAGCSQLQLEEEAREPGVALEREVQKRRAVGAISAAGFADREDKGDAEKEKPMSWLQEWVGMIQSAWLEVLLGAALTPLLRHGQDLAQMVKQQLRTSPTSSLRCLSTRISAQVIDGIAQSSGDGTAREEATADQAAPSAKSRQFTVRAVSYIAFFAVVYTYRLLRRVGN